MSRNPSVGLLPVNSASRLLLASAGPRGISAVLPAIEPGSIDWDLLVALALRERATMVLWSQLRQSALSIVPDHQRTLLQRLTMIGRFRAQHVADRFDSTLREFADANIPVMLLKGAALAQTVYRGFFDRPMLDLDLLVAESDLQRATAAAVRAGWKESPELFPPRKYEGHQHAPPLVDSEGGGVRLELHTDLFVHGHRFGLSRTELMESGERLDELPGEVSVPSLMQCFLHSCVHFAWSHMMRFGVWRTMRDVSALTSTGQCDWEAIVGAATRHRAASCCYWTLRMSKELAYLDVPDDVLNTLKPYSSELFMGPLWRHLELQVLPSEAVCPSDELSNTLWQAAIRPRRSGHGRSRPWQAAGGDNMRGLTPSLVQRMTRHSRLTAAWGRYLRGVLFTASARR